MTGSSRPFGLRSWLKITRPPRLRPCATLTPGTSARAALKIFSHEIPNSIAESIPPTAHHFAAGRFKHIFWPCYLLRDLLGFKLQWILASLYFAYTYHLSNK